MVTFDCPWCAEPAMVKAADADEVVCEACGVRAALAPDPVVRPDRAGCLRDALDAPSVTPAGT